jgi:hypothetical protein
MARTVEHRQENEDKRAITGDPAHESRNRTVYNIKGTVMIFLGLFLACMDAFRPECKPLLLLKLF